MNVIICYTDLKMIVGEIKELEFDILPNTIQKGYHQIPMGRQSSCLEDEIFACILKITLLYATVSG
jgi:hypothetical protein